MEGIIRIGSDKKKQVTLVRRTPPGDPLLHDCYEMIAAAKKPKKAAEWVMKFAGIKDLKNRAARQLVDKGVLREDTGTVLKIFKRTIYPEADGGPEQDLRRRMEKAVFTATTELDHRTVVIVALAHAANMLPRILDKKKLKGRKQRLEQLTSGQIAGAATKEAVEAVQAAIMVCAMVPIITAAT
jgi:hypothetical protein